MRRSCLVIALLMPSHAAGPTPGPDPLVPAAAWLAPPRRELARTFVERDSAALRRLLASDVMIWPPPPDAARRGRPAIDYLLGLAAATRVTHSEFRPRTVSTESGETVEDGVWTFIHRGRMVMARYDLRWRRTHRQVAFLQWEVFQ
jgi:hypothetical protein